MKKYAFIILIILISFSSTGELYKVFVDKEFGFFAVRANSTKLLSYDNRTLNIGLNDTVVWENFVLNDDRVTIISDQRLWNDTVGHLRANYKTLSYTFNKSGTYKVHLRENQIFRLPQDFNRTRDNELRTNDTLPDFFRFQTRVPTKYQTIIVGKVLYNLTNKTNDIITKKKNKVVATSGSNYSRSVEEEEEYEDYNVVPTATTKIEKVSSPYEKYTILELLKSILGKI